MYRVATPADDKRIKICLHIFDIKSANLEYIYSLKIYFLLNSTKLISAFECDGVLLLCHIENYIAYISDDSINTSSLVLFI